MNTTIAPLIVSADFCIAFDREHVALKQQLLGGRWRVEFPETLADAAARVRELAPFGASVLVKTFDGDKFQHEVIQI